MIISMTGFGAAEAATDNYTLKVEIKTLNSKFFDPALRLPKEFAMWEMDIKSILEKVLKRGKINASIEFVSQAADLAPIKVNEDLFKVYFKMFDKLAKGVNSSSDELFKLALHSPNVIVPRDDLSDIITWKEVAAVVQSAAESCQQFRATEGSRLEEALTESIESIHRNLEKVKGLDPLRVENIRSRIKKSIEDIKEVTKVDENRFEQELIYYIEKLDITEEKVRLSSHLTYFHEVTKATEANGKKLGFISQEIGREINTIGSKANDAEIQRAVVGMKESLEMVKEQVLNVL
ncbi:MAG: hypothetical protein ACI9RP_000298 [Cyclobacteriaceae bacterium]|jgi:uncharacterized protein (TIGR00255 family)